MVHNPPTSTTAARLSSSDAFDIDEFISTSEIIVNTVGFEPLPLNAVPHDKETLLMSRIHYNLLLEFYRVAYKDGDGTKFCDYLQAGPTAL